MKSMFVLALLASAGVCSAQLAAIDGTRDANYALTSIPWPNLVPWAQNRQTQFGDNQSELNNTTAMSISTGLSLFIGANLQDNGNRIEIYFSNGQSGPTTSHSGTSITFDTAFGGATSYLSIDRNGGNLTVLERRWNGSSWTGFASAGAQGILSAFNNSNTAGITGGTGVVSPTTAAAAVNTGLELFLPFSWLNANGGSVSMASTLRVAGWVASNDRGFVSNQFLGGDAGGGTLNNIGSTATNLNNIAGNQFVQLPTPGAAALLGLGGVLAMGRRRK